MNNTYSTTNTCSVHVQKSSAFAVTTATPEAVDHRQQSLGLRQENILKRNDSGIFSLSSPSPVTPSRDTHAVFSPLSPSAAHTSTNEGVMTTSSSVTHVEEPTPGRSFHNSARLPESMTNDGTSRSDNQVNFGIGDSVVSHCMPVCVDLCL